MLRHLAGRLGPGLGRNGQCLQVLQAVAAACGPSRSLAAAAALADGGAGTVPPRAALLVIGDEILSGAITDANTPWLAKALHARGVDLVRVEYIGDDKRDIVDTVLRMRQYVGPHGWLFTSGGLGATHDDKTYDAIASAFGGELKRHAETVTLMEKHYAERGVELNESRLRMADLPHPADEVLFAPGLWVPLVVINNVFVLPGIPGLFQRMLTAHIERFKGPQAYEATLYTRAGEGDLAVGLARIAGASPRVRIGSYPNTDLSAIYDPSAKYRVKLQLESRDPEALDAAVKAVQSKFATFEL